MSLAIVGAGFGRTGTMALKLALEQLGFGPCYHMMEVSKNPGHAAAWQEATRQGTANWDALFTNYHACVDWPGCSFWETLVAHYPEAKVILSVRDAEAWYRSVSNTIYQRMKIPRDDPAEDVRRTMAYELIIQQTFGGRFEDKSYAIGIYQAHIADVTAKVPADKLLTYRTGEGWGALCEFLGCAEPDDPYPHVNKTSDFRQQFGMDN